MLLTLDDAHDLAIPTSPQFGTVLRRGEVATRFIRSNIEKPVGRLEVTRFERLRPGPLALMPITGLELDTNDRNPRSHRGFGSTPGGTRTPNLLIRSQCGRVL